MQKIMVIMLFWLLMPFYSWAISLEEIQSHPERYVKMDESRSCINYIDAESIHSLRCDPQGNFRRVNTKYWYSGQCDQ